MPRSKRYNEEMRIALQTHFQPISTVTRMRCKLWTYQQPPSEKVAEFAHRIRVLGEACDLHRLEDSITRDAFICNLGIKAWIDKLIARIPPTFSATVKVAEKLEWEAELKNGHGKGVTRGVSSQGVNDHP